MGGILKCLPTFCHLAIPMNCCIFNIFYSGSSRVVVVTVLIVVVSVMYIFQKCDASNCYVIAFQSMQEWILKTLKIRDR